MTPNQSPAAKCAEEIHKASARAISNGVSRGMEGYSLTIGQAQEIILRHFPSPADEGLEEIAEMCMKEVDNAAFRTEQYQSILSALNQAVSKITKERDEERQLHLERVEQVKSQRNQFFSDKETLQKVAVEQNERLSRISNRSYQGSNFERHFRKIFYECESIKQIYTSFLESIRDKDKE